MIFSLKFLATAKDLRESIKTLKNSIKRRFQMSKQSSATSRRRFIKGAAITGAVVVAGAMAGCSKKGEAQSAVIKGKSKKKEILYRGDTKQWQEYFAVAK